MFESMLALTFMIMIPCTVLITWLSKPPMLSPVDLKVSEEKR